MSKHIHIHFNTSRTTDSEKYRFENGKLYEFDKQKNAYVFVYQNARVKSKAQAIKNYEGMD